VDPQVAISGFTGTTLVLDEEAEILFIVEGALEYLDRQGQTLAHEDWRSITDKYLESAPSAG
jgi:hypothetical protein